LFVTAIRALDDFTVPRRFWRRCPDCEIKLTPSNIMPDCAIVQVLAHARSLLIRRGSNVIYQLRRRDETRVLRCMHAVQRHLSSPRVARYYATKHASLKPLSHFQAAVLCGFTTAENRRKVPQIYRERKRSRYLYHTSSTMQRPIWLGLGLGLVFGLWWGSRSVVRVGRCMGYWMCGISMERESERLPREDREVDLPRDNRSLPPTKIFAESRREPRLEPCERV